MGPFCTLLNMFSEGIAVSGSHFLSSSNLMSLIAVKRKTQSSFCKPYIILV